MQSETISPERKRARNIGAIAALLIGALLISRVLEGAWPREQIVVFRLPRELANTATRFDASFTPVGEPTPTRGVTLGLTPPSSRDLRQRITLPAGDYIVAQEVTYPSDTARSGPSAPTKSETSRPQRVTLSGDETLVVFDAEGSE